MSAFSVFENTTPPGFHEGADEYLAPEDWLNRKFRHWRGRSGRTYVFSVYAPKECPAYSDAVVIVADRWSGALACVDLGPLPESRLGELLRLFHDRLAEVEFQVHVLSAGHGDRRSLIADIIPLAA
jgi:hypothetical protein